MKATRGVTAFVLIAMLLTSAIALSGCCTKKQCADMDAKIEQALSEARSAKAAAADATAQVQRAEAAAERAEKAAISAENAAQRAEAMANKCEAVFMQKMKK